MMFILLLLAASGTTPTVWVEFPDALPGPVRATLLEAVENGEAKIERGRPSTPSARCELRVRIRSTRRGRRVALRAHLSADADRIPPLELPLMTGRRRGRRMRFEPQSVSLAASRLASEVHRTLGALRCSSEPPSQSAPPQATSLERKMRDLAAAERGEGAPIVEISSSLGFGQRSFAYRDFLYGDLRAAQLQPTPLVNVSTSLLPDSRFHLELQVTAALPTAEVTVLDEASRSLGTRWLAASLRGGARFSLSSTSTVSVIGALRYETFGFAGSIPPSLAQGLPNLEPLSVGGGVTYRYRSSFLRTRGSVRGLYALGFGDFIAARFPNATGFGLGADLSVLFPVGADVALGGRGELIRYGLSLNPEIGAENVAGGAVDLAWQAGMVVEVEL